MLLLEPEPQRGHIFAQRVVLGLDRPQPDIPVPDLGHATDRPGDRSLDLGKQPEGDRFEHTHTGRGVDLDRDQDHMAEDDGQQQCGGATAEINQSRSF